ncbi:MAG TPA: hypothetical protein VGO56_03605 [Pyrinomonadaceae bacterium]|jgi:hypothetical protein|nr:hypothetical protein [Pyrinomonadaceae bacterium]
MNSLKPSDAFAWLRQAEFMIFRICVWAVVIASFAAIGTKAIWGKPSSVPLHYFLVLILVGILLSTFAPTLGEYAASRLHKVKFGGFEFELSEAVGEASLHLKVEDVRGWETDLVDKMGDNSYSNPFPSIKLSARGKYEYERLSLRLYLLFEKVKDPNELDAESRENFRKLILIVGKAAHAMENYTKALEVLLWLKRFTDRERNHEESRMLGTAYLWAADEQADRSYEYQNEAIPYLRFSTGKHPYQTVVFYNLGWALLSLDKYYYGIQRMRKCIRLEPRCAPWANWNIACGQKKLGNASGALATLQQIPPGPMWKDIAEDDWFKDPDPTFTADFQALIRSKLEE